jgi:DNA-binding transcriptional MerR regulator
MAEETLTLEEASNETALTPEEIMKSGEAGIIPKGKSEFTENDIELLTGVSCLVHLGLTMDEIADLDFSPVMLAEIDQYLGTTPKTAAPHTCLVTLGSTRSVIKGHMDDLDLQIDQLKRQKHALERRLELLDRLAEKIESKL